MQTVTQQDVRQGVVPFEDCQRVIKATAARVYRRVHAAGAHSVQFEDIASELAIAWCRARDNYDPSSGVPFIAYLRNGMFQHINRFVQKEIDVAISGVAIDQDVNTDGPGDGLHSRIADESIEDADDLLMERQFNAKLMSLLSPKAQQFLQLLMEPPFELVEELRALHDRAVYARSRKVFAIAPTRLTFQVIGDFMGLDDYERRITLKEIRTKVARLADR